MEQYLRFQPCGHCGSRRRVIVDAQAGLRGRCLGCGENLGAPLAAERLSASAVPLPPDRHHQAVRRPWRAGLRAVVEHDGAE